MKIPNSDASQWMYPAELVETHEPTIAELVETNEPTIAEQKQILLPLYLDLKDTVQDSLITIYGVAALAFLTYVIYHVISKLRGNEKNVQMNNFGIGLALLGLLVYSE